MAVLGNHPLDFFGDTIGRFSINFHSNVHRGTGKRRQVLEHFLGNLANITAGVWSAAPKPHKTAREMGRAFAQCLRRMMTQSVSLFAPMDVAWFLACYACGARRP
ncbi:MAG: hypothetical protein IIA72_13020 [Proteobacteria bacterium]|nr:hypothetical protein [Pseudomonadota bacterium]